MERTASCLYPDINTPMSSRSVECSSSINLYLNQSLQLALACHILRKISTMFLLAPFYLFACTVTAMRFYGHTPSTDAYTNTMNRAAESSEDDDLSFGSLFMSTDLASKNGSDFLAQIGILDTTLEEFLTQGKGVIASTVPSTSSASSSNSASPSSPMPSSSGLSARTPANQLNCQNGAVKDKISLKNQKHICTTIAGLVGSGVQGVTTIIDRTVCSEASTGHPVGCSTIMAVIDFQGSYLTTSEVSDYCQEYISHNNKECSSKGVMGDTGNKRAHVAVVNNQADPKCSGIRGKCTEISF